MVPCYDYGYLMMQLMLAVLILTGMIKPSPASLWRIWTFANVSWPHTSTAAAATRRIAGYQYLKPASPPPTPTVELPSPSAELLFGFLPIGKQFYLAILKIPLKYLSHPSFNSWRKTLGLNSLGRSFQGQLSVSRLWTVMSSDGNEIWVVPLTVSLLPHLLSVRDVGNNKNFEKV